MRMIISSSGHMIILGNGSVLHHLYLLRRRTLHLPLHRGVPQLPAACFSDCCQVALVRRRRLWGCWKSIEPAASRIPRLRAAACGAVWRAAWPGVPCVRLENWVVRHNAGISGTINTDSAAATHTLTPVSTVSEMLGFGSNLHSPQSATGIYRNEDRAVHVRQCSSAHCKVLQAVSESPSYTGSRGRRYCQRRPGFSHTAVFAALQTRFVKSEIAYSRYLPLAAALAVLHCFF